MKKLTDIVWPLIREMFLEEIQKWVATERNHK